MILRFSESHMFFINVYMHINITNVDTLCI